MNGPAHLDAPMVFRLAPFDEAVAAVRAAPPDGLNGGFDGPVYRLTEHGEVVATLDGAALTARRTPAVSALATDALARPDVTRLAVIGTGVQAREHLRAMRWVRPSIDRIDVVGRDPVSTERFVAMLRGEGLPAYAADRAGASSDDLICTCTSSRGPVLDEDAIKPGAHVNTIDSYRLAHPAARLIDDTPDTFAALAGGTLRRANAHEITCFAPAALPQHDLAVAALAARNAGLLR